VSFDVQVSRGFSIGSGRRTVLSFFISFFEVGRVMNRSVEFGW
jgi:hypothetical protein